MTHKYHTGLIVTPNELNYIKQESLYPKASFIPDPTNRYYANNFDSINSFSSFELRNDKSYRSTPKDMEQCFELIIEAESHEIAINHLSLVRTGLLLALPNPWNHYFGLSTPIQYTGDDNPLMDSEPFWSEYSYDKRVDVGLFTLNAALGKRNWIYALEKYRFSLELDCITVHSTNPVRGQVFTNNTPIAHTHVSQLAAIISAYSVIEELGLEIRASEKKPRFIDNNYKWNPDVWNDIEARLIAAGVDVRKTFNWVFRGTPTDIHVKIPDSFGKPATYQTYKDNHDKTLHIIEAIQVASWLRNMVASHKFKDISSSVSPYDVFNVQSVSRLLIMQTMGTWDYVMKKTN